MVRSRSRSTSADVALSCGEVLGITDTMAASPALLGSGGATWATPLVPLSSRVRPLSSARSSLPPSLLPTASSSGPFEPGPKPLLSWS